MKMNNWINGCGTVDRGSGSGSGSGSVPCFESRPFSTNSVVLKRQKESSEMVSNNN